MKLEKVEPNLYIQTNKSGTKSWILRIYKDGKRTYRGLGDIRFVSKKQAKEDAHRILMAIKLNEEPLQKRTAPKFAEIVEPALKEIAQVKAWRRAEQQYRDWERNLVDFAVPVIGKIPVDKITPADIANLLRPIWVEKNVKAKRARAQIERVLSWCILKGHCKAPNPASWRGNIDLLLPAPSKVHKVEHHEAPTVEELKKTVAYCISHPCNGSAALLMIIASAGRVSEVLKMHRKELHGDTWVIPEERTKRETEHSVPISKLFKMGLDMLPKKSEILFPSQSRTKVYMSIDTPRQKLIDIIGRHVTAHGIRSTFKDWCSMNGVAEIESEKALSHKWGDSTTVAYQRDELVERRRPLMEKWADELLP